MLCDKYAKPRFSRFLDGGEIADITDNMSFPYGYNVMLWGGYEDCERKILGVFPEWEEAEQDKFPLSVIKFTSNFSKKLSHRDYLGTIMSLGIDRAQTGDILIEENGAYAFVYSDIAEYICGNISKISNIGVKAEILGGGDIDIPPRKYVIFETTCASLRLDAVIAGALKMSRNESTRLISAGKVKLNYRDAVHLSRNVKEGDLISVRGHGRFFLEEAGSETRSGRLHITVKFSA
ncbi:MAG: YlmH/Sll1252 family protein [Oscillospiraceae bacterium]|nr:YlmH/Sll1252 family protein [Oscillospiraceae bacterium]